MEGKGSHQSLDNVTQLCRDLIWLETEAAVKTEATSVRDKLHQVRENYRKTVNKPGTVKESNKSMINWNEDLLSFCKANRRKYHMEDRTLKLERQRLEDQMIIAQNEDGAEKLFLDLIWLETEAAVKTEATRVRDKLHQVRENYRKTVNNPGTVKNSNKSMIDWNEDLLSFCKANRRKYHMDDRTLKLERQILEDQRIIAQYEDEVEKLRKELKEATEAKENPVLTDLSDENRPTKLGENFRELFDNEWTDAFEFLTEENDGTHREDEEAIDILYGMLKRCNESCSEALRGQQTSLAQLVSNPAYFKKKPILSLCRSKPAVPLTKTVNATQAQFAKPLPAGSLSTCDQVPGRRRQLGKQGESKETAGNGNKQPGNHKSGKMSDVEQMTDATKPNAGETDGPVISAEVEVPIKVFSKSVAAEVLKHVAVLDILPAISKDKQYQDVLRNAGVQKYLEKCFHLCWLMQAQYPPMLMDFETKPGMPFNTNVFETYAKRGPKTVRVVWPPVYLHKDGPLVCKGYAEGTKQ